MAARIEADGKPVPVELTTEAGTATIVVPPMNRWKSSARYALTEPGGYDDYTWAQKTLTPDGFADWKRLDPNADEFVAFINAWSAKSGVSVGESEASTRS